MVHHQQAMCYHIALSWCTISRPCVTTSLCHGAPSAGHVLPHRSIVVHHQWPCVTTSLYHGAPSAGHVLPHRSVMVHHQQAMCYHIALSWCTISRPCVTTSLCHGAPSAGHVLPHRSIMVHKKRHMIIFTPHNLTLGGKLKK